MLPVTGIPGISRTGIIRATVNIDRRETSNMMYDERHRNHLLGICFFFPFNPNLLRLISKRTGQSIYRCPELSNSIWQWHAYVPIYINIKPKHGFKSCPLKFTLTFWREIIWLPHKFAKHSELSNCIWHAYVPLVTSVAQLGKVVADQPGAPDFNFNQPANNVDFLSGLFHTAIKKWVIWNPHKGNMQRKSILFASLLNFLNDTC